MVDTAQPYQAADPVAAAAAAFKAEREPPAPAQNRDDAGRFAAQQPVEPPAEQIEADDAAAQPVVEAAEYEEGAEAIDDAADEAQLVAADMPSSWSKEDAELWSSLPPEAQARIAEREGQRDTALNQKFQESANARKAAEAQLAEANANRDQYAQAIQTVLGMVNPAQPDPRQFGYGTPDFDRAGYDLAMGQYQQQASIIHDLMQQSNAIAQQQAEEASVAERQAYEEIETKARPALLAAVPDIADPQKSGKALSEIVKYAVEQGIPAHVFTDEESAKRVTSAELLMAWKAKEYDRLQAAKGRVAPTAQPKPAAPPVRPGVTTPRSAIKKAAFDKDMSRLAKEGSVEAGASVWKHFR